MAPTSAEPAVWKPRALKRSAEMATRIWQTTKKQVRRVSEYFYARVMEYVRTVCNCPGRYSHELRFQVVISQPNCNRRHKQTQAGKRGAARKVDEVVRVQTPVGQCGFGVSPGHARVVSLAAFVFESVHGQRSLRLGQPACCLGVVREEEEDKKGRHARWDAFDDKQPAPGRQAGNAVHVANAKGNRAAKLVLCKPTIHTTMVGIQLTAPANVADARMNATLRIRVSHRHPKSAFINVKKDSPNAALVVSIPKGQVVDQPREQARLKHAQQEPHGRDTGKVLGAAQRHGHGAPAKHEKRKPAAGPHGHEEDVGRHLKRRIGHQEDHERNDKLVVGHARAVLHVVARRAVEHLCVANVGAVQEAEKVDGRAQRDDAHVLLEQQAALFLWVYGWEAMLLRAAFLYETFSKGMLSKMLFRARFSLASMSAGESTSATPCTALAFAESSPFVDMPAMGRVETALC